MNQLQRIEGGRRLAGLRLAGAAWRAFGPAAALIELLLVVAISIGCGVAWHVAFHDAVGDLLNFAALGAVVALIFISTNAFMGDYALPLYISATNRIRRPLAAWNIAFLYTLAISFIAKSAGDLSRGNVILLYVGGLGAVVLWRWLLIRLVVQASRRGTVTARRVLIVGERDAIQTFTRRYQPWNLGFEIVGQAVLHSGESLARDLDRAALVGRALHPDDVFVVMPWSNTETIERVVDRLMNLPVSIHLGPERILDRFARVEIIKVGDMATLCLARPPLTFLEVIAKRIFDIAAAAVGLLVLLPFLALVALLIRLDSPGPALFRQQRYGFNQKPFWIYKFRTMRLHDDEEVRQATREDDHVTRVGRHLRRWNVDELPQLINVLFGDMSLVGPRPHAVPHNQAFERRIGLYARRHNVKPGITGWAQVNGLRGVTDTDDKMRRRVEFDLYYIDNWSLSLDLQIIGRTLFSRKAYRNAY
ncbi:MAG: undecaprenyl-phosphate glucose phosphotransferase [Microvirga sp.]|jgi:Undecaprenyl-phosphate glucose phosphotransferase|nr:undecaprenyl-phosphate glucose phosphotransferase [Microvirga sp.]